MDKFKVFSDLLTGLTTEPTLKALDRIGITPFLCGYGIYQIANLINDGKITGPYGAGSIAAILIGFFIARFKEREQKAVPTATTNGVQ